MSNKNRFMIGIWAILFSAIAAVNVSAQTTAFTYQGSLQSGGSPANGNFDLEFKLFDALTNGTQQGTTQQRLNVLVSNGVFAVTLDFGTVSLPGASRFLDIAVRPAGGGTFTPLTPRQLVNSAPYAVRSLNAANADNATIATNAANATTATNAQQLGGVAASLYVLTGDPRMSDPRPPAAGSANYIQNQNAAPQATSNFNISGTGTANILAATTQFNIGANRVLSVGGVSNTFAGSGAGIANTSGGSNTFFGQDAGLSNTQGGANAFFGAYAGDSNTMGVGNAFFGSSVGVSNTTGDGNAFFGFGTGALNTMGAANAFFGQNAGFSNTMGSFNVFFGRNAGNSNTTGNSNTILGDDADVGTGSLSFATAIGSQAMVTQSNTLVLGAVNGVNGATADTSVVIGATAPALFNPRLTVVGNSFFQGNLGLSGNLSSSTLTANSAGVGGTNSGVGALLEVFGSIRSTSVSPNTDVCADGNRILISCASSIRYKKNIIAFDRGIDLISRLRPVTFNWKENDLPDLGLIAEEAARVEPLLVTHNDKGEIEGLKYSRLSVIAISAIKEQQTQIERQLLQIEAQQREIDERKASEQRLQSQIDDLKKMVCALKPDADSCKQQ